MNPLPRFAIQQGRLSDPPPGCSFPVDEWQEELRMAAGLGFDAIEWSFDAQRPGDNPIATQRGRAEIKETIAQYGVPVDSVSADYFAAHPLYGPAGRRSALILSLVIEWAAEIGAKRVRIPITSPSRSDDHGVTELTNNLAPALRIAEAHGVWIALDASKAGAEVAALVARMAHPRLGIAYDTGIAAGHGLDVASELQAILPWLCELGIGDATKTGEACAVGHGEARLSSVFRLIARRRPSLPMVVRHHARTDPAFEALRALNFVRVELARAERSNFKVESAA